MLLNEAPRGKVLTSAGLLVGVALLGVLTGCGGRTEPSSQYLDDQGLRAKVDQLAARLDFGVRDTSGAALDLEVEHERVVRKCVRSKGVPIQDPPAPATTSTVLPRVTDLELWLARGRALGLGTALSDPARLQQARTAGENDGHQEEGYPPGAEDLVYGKPGRTITVPLSGNWKGGSVTIPVGGCFGEATAQLYGVPAETFERTRLALPRVDDIIARSTAEQKVADALRDYAPCMRDRGFLVSSPAEILRTLGPMINEVMTAKKQPSDLVRAEQDLLAADAGCKTSTGLGTSFAQAFLEHGDAALKQNEAVIVEYRRMLDHARAQTGARGSGQ